MKIIKPEITAGPWIELMGEIVNASESVTIADTITDETSSQNRAGNAKAIAALPDVLEALEDVVMDAINHPSSALNGKAAHKAKLALEKAGYKFEE